MFAFLPILLFGGLFSGLIGYLIGVPILKLRDDFLAIATLGFGMLVRVLLDNSDKVADVVGGSRGFIGIPRITNLELVFVVLVFLVVVTRNLIFSKYGLFWQCIKDDELASTAFGIDTGRMKSMAFSLRLFSGGCCRRPLRASLHLSPPVEFRSSEVDRFSRHRHRRGHGQHHGHYFCGSFVGRLHRGLAHCAAFGDTGAEMGVHPDIPHHFDDAAALRPARPKGIEISRDR